MSVVVTRFTIRRHFSLTAAFLVHTCRGSSTAVLTWSVHLKGDLPRARVPSTLPCTTRRSMDVSSRRDTCPKKATNKQLRRLWMNLKQRQRDALTKERQHRLATGGGPSTSDVEIDPDISQMTKALIVCVDNVIDSDTASELLVEQAASQSSISQISSKETSSNIQETPSTSQTVMTIESPPQLPVTTQTNIRPESTSLSSTSQYSPTSILTEPIPLTYHSEPQQTTPQISSIFSTSQITRRQKSNIIEREYRDRQQRQNEIHQLEIQLLHEKIREAKAKANLAELLLKQNMTGLPTE